jgi:hypothetical protein
MLGIIVCRCPGGGIGIRSRLRACARKGVEVRLLSGASSVCRTAAL